MRSIPIQMVMFLFAGACCWPADALAQVESPRDNVRTSSPFDNEFRSAPVRKSEQPRFAERTAIPKSQVPVARSAQQQPAKKITKPSGSFATPARKPGQGASSARSSLGSFWTTLGSLALIIGFILVTAKLFKKHSPVASQALPAEAVELLGRRPLDARQSIHLIRLGSRILLVGTSPDGMQTLTEISDPVEVDYLAGMCRKTDEPSPFTNAFQTFFSGEQKKRANQSRQKQKPTAKEVAANQEVLDQFRLRVMVDPESSREQTHG